MSFEHKGLEEFQKELNTIENNIEQVKISNDISFDELFTNSFMQKYTKFETISKFLSNGGFNASTTEEFENIPEDELNNYVMQSTQFNNWQEMIEEAVSQYISNQIGI